MPALLWQLSRVPWQHAPLSRCYNKYYQQCSRQRSPVKFRNAINSIEAFAECTSARITVRVDVSSARRESTQLYDTLPVVQPLRATPPKKRKKMRNGKNTLNSAKDRATKHYMLAAWHSTRKVQLDISHQGSSCLAEIVKPTFRGEPQTVGHMHHGNSQPEMHKGTAGCKRQCP